MEKSILSLSPINLITIGLISMVVYFGVIGGKMVAAKVGIAQ